MNFALIRNEPIGRFNGLNLPDPPEPLECDGWFRSDYCEGCSNYDECAKEDYERQCDITHILENMV